MKCVSTKRIQQVLMSQYEAQREKFGKIIIRREIVGYYTRFLQVETSIVVDS
jgi:hypothetical protein